MLLNELAKAAASKIWNVSPSERVGSHERDIEVAAGRERARHVHKVVADTGIKVHFQRRTRILSEVAVYVQHGRTDKLGGVEQRLVILIDVSGIEFGQVVPHDRDIAVIVVGSGKILIRSVGRDP